MPGLMKSFLEKNLKKNNEADLLAIELATAALLVEMIRRDDDVSDDEKEVVLTMLKNSFSLNEEQTTELYTMAETAVKKTTDFSQYTDLINQQFSYQNKLQMIELLWKIALSDKQLHREEMYFVQEISELLAVSQEDFDICRDRVRDDYM